MAFWQSRLFTVWGLPPPSPCFSYVLILKEVKVVCFDTFLEVLILNELILHQNCAKCGFLEILFILRGFKLFRMNTCSVPISVDSKRIVGRRRGSDPWVVRSTARRAGMVRKVGRNLADLTRPLYQIYIICQ